MFDLHIHSNCSDGSEPPEATVEIAYTAGADLIALTDHDCTGGVKAAMKHALKLGLPMLTGIETEASYASTLHLLGIGMNINESGFVRLIKKQEAYREERNERLEKRLCELNMDIRSVLVRSDFCTTRAHYAAALVEAGYASDMNDAFGRILGKNGIAYVKQDHPSAKEIILAVNAAGGVCIVAHPMKMKCDANALINKLADFGLWGVEAYYSTASNGEVLLFSALAREHGLFITCGSDFHGRKRPNVSIGDGFCPCRELEQTREELHRRFRV